MNIFRVAKNFGGKKYLDFFLYFGANSQFQHQSVKIEFSNQKKITSTFEIQNFFYFCEKELQKFFGFFFRKIFSTIFREKKSHLVASST
jgi:hypothetical protein